MLTQKLRLYFQGEAVDFSQVPLMLDDASAFQQQVWQTARCINYGKVVSYQQIANAIGKAKSARAVGRALASNPILIIIPCHRVLTSDGKLGGYRAGVERKKQLLAMELLATKVVTKKDGGSISPSLSTCLFEHTREAGHQGGK